MRILFLFGVVVLLFGCEKVKNKRGNVKNETVVVQNNFENLFSKFKKIKIDTMEVYSSEDFGVFKGVKIDSLDVILFPKEIQEEYFLEHEMYACYRFDIDLENLGLIMRTPSAYVASSIKLFVYNKRDNKILNYLELAENIGDAGESLEVSSWIINEGVNKFKILKRNIERYDHSADDENDTIIESTSSHFLIDLSNIKLDTITYDSGILQKRFKKLLD